VNEVRQRQGWSLIVLVLLIAAGLWWQHERQPATLSNSRDARSTLRRTAEPRVTALNVNIEGEVNIPGIYQIPIGSTIAEAIRIAGGPTDDARLKALLLTQTIDADTVIYIPPQLTREIFSGSNPSILTDRDLLHVGTPRSGTPRTPGTETDIGATININTANADELATLPRIGEKTAAAIIEYRETHGRFNAIEELKNVPRIGDKTFAGLQDKITI